MHVTICQVGSKDLQVLGPCCAWYLGGTVTDNDNPCGLLTTEQCDY